MRNPVRVNIVATVLIVSSVLLALGLSGIAAPQVQRQAQRVVTPTLREADQIKQRVRPVIIRSGAVQRTPTLRTNSPYYVAQLVSKTGNLPLTLIEVDYWNSAYNYFHSPEVKGNPPVGVDQKTVVIEKVAKSYNVNFRYTTAEKNVTGVLWQVSRFPFPNDPAHWQKVPGLVGSGPVTVDSSSNDGYSYFRINFARVANHDPSRPPYYEGMLPAVTGTQPLVQAQAPPKAQAPPLQAQAPPKATPPRRPVMIQRKPEGATVGVVAPLSGANLAARLALMPEAEHTYYVRVIPMHGPNQAGVPAIPVEVTVRRPRPCPKTTADITVRPPSARIVWYMRPNFFDSYGVAHDRWYVVNATQFLPLGLHQLDVQKPEEKAWYEKVVEVFESIFNYFSSMMTAMSVTLDMLENFAVDVAAKTVSYSLGGGQIINLDNCDECKGVLKAGLQAVMVAYGVPPTLPTGPELMNLSTEYLIEAGADELGLGAVYDAYQQLPDEVKQKMQGDARNLAQKVMQANNDAMREQIEKYTCTDVPDLQQIASQGFFLDPSKPVPTKKSCQARIPDPIFNSVHPATVMVYVENRNNVATDGIVMNVTDSRGLFNRGTTRVPPLRPGQSLSVPVLLTENTWQFLDINGGKCPTRDVVTVSGEVSCQMQKWYDKFFQGGEFYQRPIQPVTFRVSFRIGSGASEYSGLDAQSSGTPVKSVILVDPEYVGCSIQGAIRYPQGWQIDTPAKSIIAETWDNLFDEAHPNPNNGMLRTK
jgi:hypothetical protein